MKIYKCFIVSVIVLMCGYLGYMRFFYTPPAPVPCTQGMTLMPGQSCFTTFEIK